MHPIRFALTGLAVVVIALGIGHAATLPALMIAACHDGNLRQ